MRHVDPQVLTSSGRHRQRGCFHHFSSSGEAYLPVPEWLPLEAKPTKDVTTSKSKRKHAIDTSLFREAVAETPPFHFSAKVDMDSLFHRLADHG